MTRNQTSNKDGYSLQPLATAQRTVVQQGPELWADSIHTDWKGGHYAPQGDNRELRLRTLFRAIRILEVGDARQKKQAGDLSRFLENAWGLKQACVAVGGKDLDAVRALREAWGDAQLPPVGPNPAEFVNGVAADEALIEAIVRRLG